MADKKLATTPAYIDEAKVDTYTITPNSGSSIKVGRGFRSLTYYESIFDTTVRVNSEIVDVGDKSQPNIVDRLKLTTGEKVELAFTDGYKNKLKASLLVKNHDFVEDVKGVVVTLNMWSEDSVNNEDTKNRVIKKYYDRLISDSVDDILKNTLKTKLKVNIDKTLNKFTFTGNKSTDTPFDKVLWLASRSIPDLPGAKGKLAGYLLFHTADGLNFKSIDKLLGEKPKLKLIYNDKVEEKVPPGYDAKILTFEFKRSMDLKKIIENGVFTKVDHIGFNPYRNDYRENSVDNKSQNMVKNNAGKDSNIGPSMIKGKAFKVTSKIDDTGQLTDKPGSFSKSKETNLKVDDIIRQSKSRYNQLQMSKLKILIPLNFKVKAGDMVEVDFPEPSLKKVVTISKRKSGLYMIESLAHQLNIGSKEPLANVTSLTLIRDTEEKKSGASASPNIGKTTIGSPPNSSSGSKSKGKSSSSPSAQSAPSSPKTEEETQRPTPTKPRNPGVYTGPVATLPRDSSGPTLSPERSTVGQIPGERVKPTRGQRTPTPPLSTTNNQSATGIPGDQTRIIQSEGSPVLDVVETTTPVQSQFNNSVGSLTTETASTQQTTTTTGTTTTIGTPETTTATTNGTTQQVTGETRIIQQTQQTTQINYGSKILKRRDCPD